MSRQTVVALTKTTAASASPAASSVNVTRSTSYGSWLSSPGANWKSVHPLPRVGTTHWGTLAGGGTTREQHGKNQPAPNYPDPQPGNDSTGHYILWYRKSRKNPNCPSQTGRNPPIRGDRATGRTLNRAPGESTGRRTSTPSRGVARAKFSGGKDFAARYHVVRETVPSAFARWLSRRAAQAAFCRPGPSATRYSPCKP